MNHRILIVDDEEGIRSLLATVLRRAKYEALEMADAASLKEAFSTWSAEPAIIFLDLKLPDADGIELLPLIKRHWPTTEVIILTGYASLDAAVTATKLGAYDFQNKPFEPKTLLLSVERALEHRQLREETSSLRQALSTMSGATPPLFQSAPMKEIIRTIERVAPSDVSILIVGESGTGKEVIADLIHNLSPRSGAPIIKVNCAALPRELIESELFGSVKGAFTGAQSDREGLFHQADGGTIMLDEIAEMPVDTQSKLLRVLQEKQFRPVGSKQTYNTDCRVITATNLPIEEAIEKRKLREDLYYRVGTITVKLPPLRERREDIMPLANSFLKRFAAQAGRNILGFSNGASESLRKYDWPGNVRQLQNEVQRAILMCEGQTVDVQDLSVSNTDKSKNETELTLLEGMERNTIIQLLKETGGNKLETARRLGIGRQTLYNKIKAYGIST